MLSHARVTPLSRAVTIGLLEQIQAQLGSEYTVERELGGGGMSRVFVAEEKRLGRRVVVKILSPELAAGVSAERFEREIRLAAQLQDPRIVPLLTAGQVSGLSYYTMPFVEGESLRERLARGPVPLADAIGILRDLALALDYAHARQVVHRDIKPENVLLTRGTAVVTDFGIAKAISAATEGESRSDMTAVGAVIGTPAYMAPEQAAGEAVDARADLYAWGIIAYELVAGVHPFGPRATAQAVLAAHIAESPAPLSTRARDVPATLSGLIDRSLAKDPRARPQSASEIVRTLDTLGSAGVGRSSGAGRARRTFAIVAAAVIVATGLAASVLLRDRSRSAAKGGGASAAPRSLAVLPFTSPDQDSSNAYFGAGMAEELTTAFARVPGLRVASRGSTSPFLAAGVSEAEIARRLGVETILEGSVRRAGDRIRVTARLVDPKDGTVLWADRYDRRMAQIFDVQDEMAKAIVTALRPRFSGGTLVENARAVRGTEDLVAYDLYLKGRYYWGRRGESGLRAAVGYFQRALERDSNFARAWAGLSMAQVVMPYFSDVRADSVLTLASANAQHALRLDSTLADAHLAWAYALKTQWRWPQAEAQFKRALELAPDDATIHHWFGVLMYVLGRVDEAIAQLRRAQQLDPLSASVGTDLYYAMYLSGQYDDALTEGLRVWRMDTTKADGSLEIGMIQLARGRPDSALRAFEAAKRLGIGFDVPAFISVADRQLGRTREADSLYHDLLARYRADRALAYAVTIAAAGAKDRERGIGALEQTIRDRSVFPTELSLPCDPIFDSLRGDARFSRLVSEMGLQPCAR
jgi:serine/threonine-protein kinase